VKFFLISVLFSFHINVSAQSPYEEPVNIPPYDPNNPDMFLITSDSDWSHINDPAIHYFYVQPGDYSNAGLQQDDHAVVLTASGTASQMRYICLYNGNDLHPGKLDTTELAKVGLILRNADYWVVDRMAFWNSPDGRIPVIFENASHNILNRYFIYNVAGGLAYIFSGSNNVIQNCRAERDDPFVNLDRAAIALDGEPGDSIVNTHIVNNEIYNFVDGFQAVKGNPNGIYNYAGTVVDHNLFFIDSLIYTDCNGHPDPQGNCAYAENGIDLKSGSEDASNPFLVTGNVLWGFRQADETDSDLDDVGSAIVCHYNVNNTIISGNVIFNSTRGMTVEGAVNGAAMRNSEFIRNILYGIRNISIKIYDTHHFYFEHNLNKETGLDFPPGYYSNWLTFIDSDSIFVRYNLSVNTHDNNGVRVDNSTVYPYANGYYNSLSGDIQNHTDTLYSTDPTATYDDFVTVFHRFTNHPDTLIIPRVMMPGLAILEQNPPQYFRIYPNPAHKKIFILAEQPLTQPVKVRIFDMSGKEVLSQKVPPGKIVFEIHLRNLKPGPYLLQTLGKKKVGMQRLIIEP